MIINLHVEFLILDPNTNIQKEKLDLTHLVRHAIITEKVNICLTLLGHLPPPYFLLSKAKASCSLTPPPCLQSQQNLHSEESFSFDGTPF